MSEPNRRVPPELDDVANQVGAFIEYWGFKNVHGRIWAHIFLSDAPLDAGELIERLGVSKALVSMSISDLMEHEVIEVAGKSSRGTTTYCSNPNIMDVIMKVLRKRERRMLARVSMATRLLKTLTKTPASAPTANQTVLVSAERADILDEMVRTAEETLDAMLQFHPAQFSDFTQFCTIPKPTA